MSYREGVRKGNDTMTPVSQRIDPRVLRTRHLIRDAFIDLLQEIEIEKITVNRLTERATINRVTFYLHYRDIPDMMEKMADDMANIIQDILKEEVPAPPIPDVSRIIRMLEHFAENSKFYKVLLASKRIPIFSERFLKIMLDDIADKIEKRRTSAVVSVTGVPKDIVLWYSSSAYIGTIISWLRNDMPYTPSFLAKQLLLLAPFATTGEQHVDGDS